MNLPARVLVVSALLSSAFAVLAQTPPPSPAPAAKASQDTGVRPRWNELTPAQRDALAPLAGMWETLGPERKRKWLEVAAKYPRLTPDAQQRVQQRMGEFARLSPEEKTTARENFRRNYELPADQRQEKLQLYKDLPEDKKRALSEKAAKKQAAPKK
ncbi:MAG: DUF3106 domain-containing protein [Burkholderiaceae bacterium]